MKKSVAWMIVGLSAIVVFKPSLGAPRGNNDNLPRIARYTTVAPVPTPVQRDPLSVVVEVNFPMRIANVGEAIQYLLRRSGYDLASTEVSDPMMPTLLASRLPDVHRGLGPITLERALETVAGDPWELVSDPVHRLVSYELRPDYRFSYGLVPGAGAGADAAGQQLAGADPEMMEEPIESGEGKPDRGSSSTEQRAGGQVVAPRAYEPRARAEHYILDEDAEEQYRDDQYALMAAKIPIDIRDMRLEDAIREILPPGWDVDVQISDPAKADAHVDLTGQTTRRQILMDLLSPLDLQAEFYPAMRPRPLVVVSEEK